MIYINPGFLTHYRKQGYYSDILKYGYTTL